MEIIFNAHENASWSSSAQTTAIKLAEWVGAILDKPDPEQAVIEFTLCPGPDTSVVCHVDLQAADWQANREERGKNALRAVRRVARGLEQDIALWVRQTSPGPAGLT